jgi:transcriptional regulator with XRE-family HTH domain
MKVVEMRVRLAKEVRRRRLAARMSQRTLAERIHVSQPRIPAIESGSSVSLETVMLAFFATGGSSAELGAVVAGE